jgi:transposase, IS5 family
MSTRMDGIHQPSLFSSSTLRMDVIVPADNRYRLLSEKLPWLNLAEAANIHRKKHVALNIGRPLDLRLHLGAFIVQSMNRWTDRETEEMVRFHAGVRLLCGLEQSNDSIDHTSIETFRNQLGAEGVESLNRLIVECAKSSGFTDGNLCSSDTTVQEAPIAYPTEVGHMKKIAEKLVGIGARMKKGLKAGLGKLSETSQRLFTKIRLFTRGTSEKAINKKKKLGQELQKTVAKMERLVREEFEHLGGVSQNKYREQLELYKKMLSQIRFWIRTGFHRPGKIVSLWAQDARAITRNKAGKATEFGRRWIVSRLTAGYVIGTVCKKLGSGADTGLMPEILEHFERMMRCLPEMVVYDRGGDGPKNHRSLKKKGIQKNCIFRKGKVSQPGLGRNTAAKARRERALSEATIATIKNPRFGFNKPRAKSSETIVLKGHAAILGANLAHLTRDWAAAMA